MIVYISGKITGTDDYFERFDAAEKRLVERGYTVLNPARFNACHPEGTTWEKYMRYSIKALCDADIIYMLNGWKDSKGAKVEFQIATVLNMVIMMEESEDPAKK